MRNMRPFVEGQKYLTKFNMDIVVKMDRFQILQNALKVKYTLAIAFEERTRLLRLSLLK